MHRSSNNPSTKGGVAPMYRHPGCSSSDATQRSAHYKSKFDATRRELAAAREAAAQAARERAEADEEAHAARAAAAREEAAIAALANSAVSRQRHAGGLATRNRLLVQEVRELREQLADRGGQRGADAYRTRDAALDALDARDARLQELGATLSEQGHQLERTEHAARVAHARAYCNTVPDTHGGLTPSLARTDAGARHTCARVAQPTRTDTRHIHLRQPHVLVLATFRFEIGCARRSSIHTYA